MAQLELTEQEGNALVQLLDVAVKAEGIKVANDALVLVRRVQAAFAPKIPVEAPAEEPKEEPKKKG